MKHQLQQNLPQGLPTRVSVARTGSQGHLETRKAKCCRPAESVFHRDKLLEPAPCGAVNKHLMLVPGALIQIPSPSWAGERVPILHLQVDSPAGLHPSRIEQTGEGSRDHVLTGVVTGTGGVSMEDRLKRDMILPKNIRRTAN